jgi:hypothetical protein
MFIGSLLLGVSFLRRLVVVAYLIPDFYILYVSTHAYHPRFLLLKLDFINTFLQPSSCIYLAKCMYPSHFAQSRAVFGYVYQVPERNLIEPLFDAMFRLPIEHEKHNSDTSLI